MSPVEVRYPRSKQEERGDRSRWPWLPGSILHASVGGKTGSLLCLLRRE